MIEYINPKNNFRQKISTKDFLAKNPDICGIPGEEDAIVVDEDLYIWVNHESGKIKMTNVNCEYVPLISLEMEDIKLICEYMIKSSCKEA